MDFRWADDRQVLTQFVRSEIGGKLKAMLADRGPGAPIIGPRWLRDELDGDFPDAELDWSILGEKLHHRRFRRRAALVITGDAWLERRLAHECEALGAARTATLLDDLIPAIVTQAKVFDRQAEPTHRYVVLSLPRTGGTYLCALLANRGLGRPGEHVRDPLALLIRDNPDCLEAVFAALERYGTRNGTFGTKLVSPFLLLAANQRPAAVAAILGRLVDMGYLLLNVRRDLVESVVSTVYAHRTGVWHILHPVDAVCTRRKAETITLADDELRQMFFRLAVQQVATDLAFGRCGPLTIAYEDIEVAPEAVLARIASALGASLAEETSATLPVPAMMRANVPGHEAAKARLRHIIAEERAGLRDEIVAAVLPSMEPDDPAGAGYRLEAALAGAGLA